jgi:GH24 family phage-related lysozyme (muramidase)
LSAQPQKPQRKRTPAIWLAIPALAGGLWLGSDDVRNIIEKWESGSNRVLVVYADKLAGGLPTVCNGLTRHVTTTPIVVGERWTDEKCEAHEAAVTHTVQRELSKCFKRKPPQKVFDSGSSHSWNFGVGRTCGSESMRQWNAGNWAYGCLLLAYTPQGKPNWSSAGGQFYPGLFNRRKDEMQLCLSGLGQ